MKKNNIKNKNLLSALTIGISAMMFLQTPISAYAAQNDELNENPPSEPKTESNDSQSESSYVPVTNDAQTEATQAYDACVSETPVVAPQETPAPEQTAETPAPEQTAETPAPEQTAETPAAEQTQAAPTIAGAEVEANEAADLIVNGKVAADGKTVEVEKAGEEFADAKATPEAITGLVKAAEVVLNDKAEGSEKLSNIQAAAKDIAGSENSAKEQIKAAEEANKVADEAYGNAVAAVDKAADLMGTTEGEKAPGLIKTQENIDKIVDDTNTKGQEIVNKIANAQTAPEIEAAKEELNKMIEDSKGDLKSQIELFEGLSDSFDKAVKELQDAQKAMDKAEENYQGALDNAETKTDDAQDKVNIASQKVEKLAEAMDEALAAIDGLETDADGLADKRGNKWGDSFKSSVDDRRQIMWTVIQDYYLSEVLNYNVVIDDEHPIDFSKKTHSGPNGEYEKNYTKVNFWYLDENNELKQDTKYFNWDAITKTDTANENLNNNKNNNNEASTGMVIYEKSELEVDAAGYIERIALERVENIENKSAYQRNGEFVLSDYTDNYNKCKKQGMFTLYTYIDDEGNEQYITQFELFGKYPGKPGVTYNNQGDLTKVFTPVIVDGEVIGYKNPDGVEFKGLTMVTPEILLEKNGISQNQNGLYKDANCLILGDTDVITAVLNGDKEKGYGFVKENVVKRYGISQDKVDELIEANARFNRYIDTNSTAGINNLKDKYNTYAAEVAEAQIAVKNAQTQVTELSGAIDELRDKSVKNSKTMIAREALGVNDIATHFGLTGLDEAQAAELNNMTLVQLISKLTELRKDAKDNIELAKQTLNDTIDKLIKSGDEAAVRPTGGGDAPSTGGEDTPDAGGDTTPDTPSTPAAPAGGTIATTTTTNPSPSAAPVLAAVEAAMAADAGAGQANPAAQAIADFAAGQADQGGAGNVEIADGDVALAETPDAAPVVEETDETLANKADIEDPAVALASGTTVNDEARKMNWWWILIVALLGVTGKKMYEEHMRKEEEKNKNKID
jgi:predicted  nucleic acid-binding Zn-ribbon protein